MIKALIAKATPPDGNMIKKEWLKRYPASLPRSTYRQVIITMDPAGKAGPNNDYSAITVLGLIPHLRDQLGRANRPDGGSFRSMCRIIGASQYRLVWLVETEGIELPTRHSVWVDAGSALSLLLTGS